MKFGTNIYQSTLIWFFEGVSVGAHRGGQNSETQSVPGLTIGGGLFENGRVHAVQAVDPNMFMRESDIIVW